MKIKYKIFCTFSLIILSSSPAFILSKDVITSLSEAYFHLQRDSLVSMLAAQELGHLGSEIRFHLTKMVARNQKSMERENIEKHFSDVAVEMANYRRAFEYAAVFTDISEVLLLGIFSLYFFLGPLRTSVFSKSSIFSISKADSASVINRIELF